MTTADVKCRFEARLLRPAKPAGDRSWTFVVLPREASEQLPRRGRTTVAGRLNGHPFQATLEPDGQLSHWLQVSSALQEAAGAAAGDVVTLELAPVASEPEPEIPSDLQAALAANSRVVLPEVGRFADGVAVAQVGKLNFEFCRHYVDAVVTVGNDAICTAVRDIYNDTRSITEPSGALAVAGLREYVRREGICDKTLIAINSGANIDFDRLGQVIERAGRENP